ncbi:MAG TPA: c-type cytochrome, partial [Chitinophagaceae bacterium]|nr:c-type cytochrome [Chitinophagaceae bacterium]
NHNSDERMKKGSGLYRLQDTNGDDQYDKLTLLKELEGEGEHGPHSIKLSPDGQSLFVIAGNFTRIPEMQRHRIKPDGKLDNLLPFIKDPNGHDNTVFHYGGWIAKTDSTGANWELYASGFRNPFDMAFNDAGDLFTYDSDMEWDLGSPWYRPTRILHVTSGSEFGWRPGTEKWSPRFPDNNPSLLNIGQGSPTNVVYGGNARFPEKYRKSLFAFDWSFGIIYSIQLEPSGSTYKAQGEEFLSGSPLPLTDGVIGPDGALYFLTGGRRLESDLYRVYYDDGKMPAEELPKPVLNAEQKTRRMLEELHSGPQKEAVDLIWPHLSSSDRHIRYAARVALEHQPLDLWKARVQQMQDPVGITQVVIALARTAPVNDRDSILSLVRKLNYNALSESQQFDLLRAIELVLARMGQPGPVAQQELSSYLDNVFPHNSSNDINRQLSKLLIFLESPLAVSKTMALLGTAKDVESSEDKNLTSSADLIMRNPQYGMDIAGTLSKLPPQQQTFLATALSQAKSGWTDELREQYFKWFYNAFSYKGGYSFRGFINLARKNALSNVPSNKLAYYNALSGDSIAEKPAAALVEGAISPVGPGRGWKLDEAMKYIDSGMRERNFEKGKGLFVSTLCASCHTMNNMGGTSGPDLTGLGTRFSYKDMLEAIIEPNKTISDQYGATVFSLKKGGSVVGRLVSEEGEYYQVSQNPFVPQQLRSIDKKDVSAIRVSEVSPMISGLINSLNPEELKDLLAYLKSGGNAQYTIFKQNKNISRK